MIPGRATGVCREPGAWYDELFTVLGKIDSAAVAVAYQTSGGEQGMAVRLWLVHAGVETTGWGQYHRYNWVEDPTK